MLLLAAVHCPLALPTLFSLFLPPAPLPTALLSHLWSDSTRTLHLGNACRRAQLKHLETTITSRVTPCAGIQLIQRNDELCYYYEQLNLQSTVATRGEEEIARRDEACGKPPPHCDVCNSKDVAHGWTDTHEIWLFHLYLRGRDFGKDGDTQNVTPRGWGR